MTLLYEERIRIILELLDVFGNVRVRDLAQRFSVSMETVRRDLEMMETESLLKKVHGGAVKITFDRFEPPHEQRMTVHLEEKQRIGRRAAELIAHNDIIAVDVGTTTQQLLYALHDKRGLTVLINSVDGLNTLIELKKKGRFAGNILFIGGEINCEQLSSYGHIADEVLDRFFVDKVFVSTAGLSMDGGLANYGIIEGSLTAKMLSRGRETILMMDHSKIGVRNFYRVAGIDAIDFIICDKEPPADWKDELERRNVSWLTA